MTPTPSPPVPAERLEEIRDDKRVPYVTGNESQSMAAELIAARAKLERAAPPVAARPADLPMKDWRGWDLCAQAFILAWREERRATLTAIQEQPK